MNHVPVWFGRSTSSKVSELAVRGHGNWKVLNIALVEAAWWTGRWREINDWYEECIKKIPQIQGRRNLSLRDLWLGRAILLMHCSDDPTDHETAISYWEQRVKEDVDPTDIFVRDERLHLSRWILDKARAETHSAHAESTQSTSFIRRLQNMYWRDEASGIFRLTLARLYVTTGREKDARDLLRPSMAASLDGLKAKKNWMLSSMSFQTLEELLAAANDDLNAGVAYHFSAWLEAKNPERHRIDYKNTS